MELQKSLIYLAIAIQQLIQSKETKLCLARKYDYTLLKKYVN